MTRFSLRLTGAAGIVVVLMFVGLVDAVAPFASFVGDAQARVGRPLTLLSSPSDSGPRRACR
jgi:hypothetical protein